MWNIFFIGFLLCTPSLCDVSHLVRQGYGAHKPEHPLELPGEGSHNHDHSVHGYPKTVPDNPLHIPDASTGHVNNQIPDSTGSGTSDGGFSITKQHHNHGHGNYDHNYQGQDGRYNPHDDGSAWDIRKSVPGEPGRDYPIYDAVPTTSFTCKDKVPGYYADEEARCQAFSVCTTSSERTYFNFLCPNGTLFNQRVLTCDWWMNVDCAESRQYFFKNEAIGKMPTGPQFTDKVMNMLEAPDNNPYHFDINQQSHIDHMRQKMQDNDLQGSGPGPIQDLYLPVPEPTPAPIPTTTTTTTTTTTSRPSISQSSLGNVNVNEQNLLNVNTSSSSEEDTRYNLSQSSSRNVTTEEERRKLEQSTATAITQDPNQVGGKQMHVNQVLHVSNTKPAQKQQGDDLFVTPILSKPSTGGHVSQVLHSNSIPAQTHQGSDPFVTPILSKPSKTDGQLHVSHQVLHSNSIPAQKQQGGEPFVTPILSKPSKTDGQPLTSKLPKNPHAPFVSKEKSVDNKLFVSKEKADGKLYTSELKPVNNPQALFVSSVAKDQHNKLYVSKEKTDNKLFTSELKPSVNPQPLFVSRESKPFVSKENTNTINPNKLFISPEHTNKTLFISPIAASSDNVGIVSQIDQSNIGNVMVQNELNQTSSSSLDNTALIDQGSTGKVNVDESLNQNRGSQIEPGYVYTRPGPAISGDSSSSGPTGQKIPTLTVTKENTHTVTHSEKTTHVFQDGTQEPQQINVLDQSRNVIGHPDPHITTITHSVTGLNRQPEQNIPGVQSQLTITQKEISTGVQPQLSISQQGISDIQPQLGLPQPTPQFIIPQHRDSNIQPIPTISNVPSNLNRDQAIQHIEQIQRGFQQITDQQRQLNQFGFGIINPRKLEQPIPVTNFGQFGSESFPAQNYQGYQFPPQNQPNFQYQQAISTPNFNIEFSKDGSSNNYNGHSLTQHTDGQTHTTFTGNNVAFKESTKVDIVPALGFHLNDAIEKSSYISAVLGGLINEGPSNQRTFSANTFQQSPFPPTDVRYSSYQGPSSYLVPQGSVPRLPSDSGYRYR